MNKKLVLRYEDIMGAPGFSMGPKRVVEATKPSRCKVFNNVVTISKLQFGTNKVEKKHLLMLLKE